jgi:aspartate 1-decarboxylase
MVVSITTGARIETFLAAEKKDSGIICMNGVAANRIREGEEIIIYGFELVGYGNMPNKPYRISVEFNRGRNVLKRVG